MGKRGFKSVDGTIAMVRKLLTGELVHVEAIASHLGVNMEAARRYQRALGGLPGMSRTKIGRKLAVRADKLVERPPAGPRDVAAACLMSSLVTAIPDTRIGESARRLRESVLALSKEVDHAEHLDRKFWFVAGGGEASLPKEENAFADAIQAIVRARAVSFDYVHFDGTEEHGVCVKPLSLVLYEHQFYVIAQRDNGTFHPYRFARVAKLRIGAPFQYPSVKAYSPADLLRNSFGIFISQEGPIEDVCIRLQPSWRSYVEGHRWHSTQRHEVVENGTVVLRLRVRMSHELQRWVLWFGSDAEVLAPAGLRDAVAATLTAAAERYRSHAEPSQVDESLHAEPSR